MNRWKVKEREAERNGKETDQEELTKLPMAIGPAAPLPTNPCNQLTSATGETVQYAAVRKPVKKSYSLPECNCGPDTAPPSLEVSNCGQ